MTLSAQGMAAVKAIAGVLGMISVLVGGLMGLDARIDSKIKDHDRALRDYIRAVEAGVILRSTDRWTATQERLIAKERESMMNEWSEHWRRYIRSLGGAEPIDPPPLWREPDPRDILNRDD